MDVGWTNDGKKLASAGADNIVKVWDYEKGEKLRDIAAAAKQVTRLIFVPKTANFITAAGDSGAKLWNAESGSSSKSYDGGKDFLYAVAVSEDGKTVATGGEDGIARLYISGGVVKSLLPPGEEMPKDEPKKKK